MTDESGGADAVPTEESSVGSKVGKEISETVAKLGAGEKFAVLGAAGVLGVWLVFDLLIDEYFTGHLAFVLALVVVAAAYLHHTKGSGDWAVPYKTVVSVCAGLLGVLGAWFLIEEVRGDILGADAATVLGALIFYVASIVSGVGAWQLSKQ